MLGGKCHKTITVYFNPGTTFEKLKEYLQRNRNILDPVALDKKSTPFMICGCFNYNIKLKHNRRDFLTFMEEQFNFISVTQANQQHIIKAASISISHGTLIMSSVLVPKRVCPSRVRFDLETRPRVGLAAGEEPYAASNRRPLAGMAAAVAQLGHGEESR